MPVHSPFASVSATREVLFAHGLDTKKALGQHFLINDGIVGRICDMAEVSPDDLVLEVGPGIGTLTAALLKRAQGVVAIERDADLIPVLEDTLKDYSAAFSLIDKDALEVEERDIAGAVKARFAGTFPNKFVANLPYAVAATIVLDYFQNFEQLQSATIMVQSEVADRMSAQPGTKNYGAYTVKLSLFARSTARFTVGPQNFYPPPRVNSAVIRLDRYTLHTFEGEPVSADVIAATCIMAEAAFATRRKTILNSCKVYFDAQNKPEIAQRIPEVLSAANVDPRVRGESLTPEEYLVLGRALHQMQEGKL